MRGGGVAVQGTVLALFGAALAAGVAELLLPAEDSGTARLFRFLISLVVLLLILTPFLGFLQESEDLLSGEIAFEEIEIGTDAEQIFADTVHTQSKAEFEERLYVLLEKEYGIAQKNATVLPRFDAQGELVSVSVYLSGSAVLQDPDALEKALSGKLGCRVEVR